MFEILSKEHLNNSVVKMNISAPLVAKKAEPGQFIILRASEDGERIPLTIADYNRELGTVTIIFQTVGASTRALSRKDVGDFIPDFAGPLGHATDCENLKKVAIIGGGVGCAIALPIAKKLYNMGVCVHSVTGFRSSDLVILEDEFSAVSHEHIMVTDDGSRGEKGLVTHALKRLIDAGNEYDAVFAIGPLVMMKFVSALTKEYNIKTIVSMNPIMIDGTGMCGGCRLTVGGETKFACVDGPDFDGHLVDFDEAIDRASMYKDFERQAYEKDCNLFKGVD
ncbi:MAG: sulfide/dihydroorotate dehydrogenase-like FAD/NAD-binding protein [Ruminococcaceae bacterium]|nr:sulfide/dihydroorotate dehydrogenase-like FAD/NAD-binding protein [Oscillospiraceae bacterium]